MKKSQNASFEIVHHGAVDGVTGSCHQLFFGYGGSGHQSIYFNFSHVTAL